MEWIMMSLCAVVLLFCAVGVLRSVGAEEPFEQEEHTPRGGASDAREAHYMANFWSYDGSQQQDWEED